MALFFEFLGEQWLLVAALLATIMLLVFHESRRGGAALTPRQLVALVNQENALVIDLREPAEYKRGHIVDAINLPYNKLAERITELERHRERPLVMVCRMGTQAGAAGRQLAAKGFQRVHRLGGGVMEWQAQQLPLVKD